MFWKKKKDKDGEEDSQKMGMLQRLAMKKVMSMDSKEREILMHKALSPENIAKNKNKILETMEQMKVSGQLTEEQMKMAKEKLGLKKSKGRMYAPPKKAAYTRPLQNEK